MTPGSSTVAIKRSRPPHRGQANTSILERRPHSTPLLDAVGKVVGYRNLDSIGRTLAPVLVRRRKEQVLRQLPERLEKRFS